MTTLPYQVNNFKNFKSISEAANLEKRMKKLNFCPLFKMDDIPLGNRSHECIWKILCKNERGGFIISQMCLSK